MKYFTPELYLKGNSPHEDEVEDAEEQWERAIARYRKHLKKIERLLPESVRTFHEGYCLHDAEVFGPARLSVQTLPWGFHDVVVVTQNANTLFPQQQNSLMFLQYAVTAEPIIEVAGAAGKFRQGGIPLWLYDEFDVVEPGIFSHEVLLSNGQVVQLRFRELCFHLAPIISLASVGSIKGKLPGKAASA